MINKLISTIALTLVLFSTACSDAPSSVTPLSSTDTTDSANTISFSGIAVDGYISGATVCLDININGLCDIDEPTTTTAGDGTFTFTEVEVSDGLLLPVIVVGGLNTATNKAFVGEMKNIVNTTDVKEDIPFMITPLTDLIASVFIVSDDQSVKTLTTVKTDIASALGLTKANVEIDPMQNKEVFAKAQEVQQLKELILASVLKSTEIQEGSTQADKLLKNISLAIAESLKQESSELDAKVVITQLQTINIELVIPSNEVEFISAQVQEIARILESLVSDDTVTISDLENQQISLKTVVETATQNIVDATEDTEIVVVVTETIISPPSIPDVGESTNTKPTADAGVAQNVNTTTVVTLNGSNSSDADQDALMYSWSITSKPTNSTAVLSSVIVVKPTFTADKDGKYIFTLVVNDGIVDSESVTVVINSIELPPSVPEIE